MQLMTHKLYFKKADKKIKTKNKTKGDKLFFSKQGSAIHG